MAGGRVIIRRRWLLLAVAWANAEAGLKLANTPVAVVLVLVLVLVVVVCQHIGQRGEWAEAVERAGRIRQSSRPRSPLKAPQALSSRAYRIKNRQPRLGRRWPSNLPSDSWARIGGRGTWRGGSDVREWIRIGRSIRTGNDTWRSILTLN
ncbi:hypothetical protein I7I51_07018 [Histoplasma capsulatum]|uniref:Uncharacterized protein n=1 Tax=Ajellomyces capsulatus TaxID=5037 RepID=A0A8A1MJX1_AJECA|nr:hypothetical protein I7I51_07018 [Histoplasma capsulatum]